MTIKIDIKEQYLAQFEALLKTLPVGAVEVKKTLDDEIDKRVEKYKSGKMKTTSFMVGLDEIRENLVSKL
ncbi:hypothetical protein CRU92_08185 [Arcobacter sp. FW59]|nr:hypothetical protein CRU92_08185 [Arcobacter sp. FW59]